MGAEGWWVERGAGRLANKSLSLALTLHDHAEGHGDDGALRVIEKDTLHDTRRRTCGTRLSPRLRARYR